MNSTMSENKKLSCPECNSENLDVLEDEGVAICKDCYLEWPYSPSGATSEDNKYAVIAEQIRNRHKDFIAKADINPDMWYEVFVTHDDGSTESIDSGDTFEEAAKNFALHFEIYGGGNLSIDIWQNREYPEPIVLPVPELRDGQSYIIHLKNGRKIYRAEYHHCTLSGKHYFAKGDDVYPIENVLSHSMKACEAIYRIPPQTLTDEYYGHLIKITFTSVIPHSTLTYIPDSVYDCIIQDLKESVTEGAFEEEQTGEAIYIPEQKKEVYTVTAGSWRVVKIDHHLMLRIARWTRNFGFDERLTKELFSETYGSVMGEHYRDKWENLYRHDIIKMVAYLDDHKEGQKFCDMVYKQMVAYENRINEKK